MAKTYKKIGGTWYPIKKIFKRISGAWSEVKKLYKKVSGTWQVVHSGAYEYTFTANASNVNFATLIGSSAVANNTDFIITINSGVTLSGTVGVAGANNASTAFATGNVGTRVCKNSQYTDGRTHSFSYSAIPNTVWSGKEYYTGNGGTGGTGATALDISGMSGKKITIINNGTIVGGTGGNGGIGAAQVRNYNTVTIGGLLCGAGRARLCGISGSGGSGGSGLNNGANTVSVTGNSPINGTTGVAGAYGWAAVEDGAYDGCG